MNLLAIWTWGFNEETPVMLPSTSGINSGFLHGIFCWETSIDWLVGPVCNAQHSRILLHQKQSQIWMPLGTCPPVVPWLGLGTPTQERKKHSLCCKQCWEKRKRCITCQSRGAPYPPRQTWCWARLVLKWSRWKAIFQNKGPVSLSPVLLHLKLKTEGKHALKTPFLQLHQVCLWSSASPWIPVTENSVLLSVRH